jgi:hypothetical protein
MNIAGVTPRKIVSPSNRVKPSERVVRDRQTHNSVTCIDALRGPHSRSVGFADRIANRIRRCRSAAPRPPPHSTRRRDASHALIAGRASLGVAGGRRESRALQWAQGQGVAMQLDHTKDVGREHEPRITVPRQSESKCISRRSSPDYPAPSASRKSPPRPKPTPAPACQTCPASHHRLSYENPCGLGMWKLLCPVGRRMQ